VNNALANTGRSPVSTGSAVSASPETMVPLSAFSRFSAGITPHAVVAPLAPARTPAENSDFST